MSRTLPEIDYLYTLSISQLRNIDIKNVEDEMTVQGIINSKLAAAPEEWSVDLSDIDTDAIHFGKMKESDVQAEIDRRRGEARMRFIKPEAVIEEKKEQTEAPIEAPKKRGRPAAK